MANSAIEEGTRSKILIRGEWCKVPNGYPKDAPSQLECDQRFITELAKHLVAELRVACQLNTSLGAKPKSSHTKSDFIYRHTLYSYL